MKTEIWTCDRCRASGPELQVIKVAFVFDYMGFNSYSKQHTGHVRAKEHEQDWCEPCCNKTGFFKYTPQPEPAPAAPTLEDLVRELAYDGAREALEGR